MRHPGFARHFLVFTLLLFSSVLSAPARAQPYSPAEETLESYLRAAKTADAAGADDVARDLYAATIVRFGYTRAFADVGDFHRRHGERLLAQAAYERFLEQHPEHRRAPEIRAYLARAEPDSKHRTKGWPAIDHPPRIDRTGEHDVALLVGVQDYAYLPEVPGARRNVADWERFLADGLGVDQVFSLTDREATREEILEFARRAAHATRRDSTLWFVFVGHGAAHPDRDSGVLVGVDGQQNLPSIAARGVRQDELLNTLESGAQARTVAVLDACFSGRDRTDSALVQGVMPTLPVGTLPGITDTTVVLTAAESDQFAGDLPSIGRPAFSYLVLGGLRGWADDGDGRVTAEEVVRYATLELGKLPGRRQTPHLQGPGETVLTRGATEGAPRIYRAGNSNRDDGSDRDRSDRERSGGTRLETRIERMELAY